MNSLMRMSLMLNKIEDVCVLVRLLDAHVYQLRRFDWITHDGKRCKCALVRSYAFLSSVPVELIQFAHRMQSSPYLHTAADVSLLFRFPIPLFPWNSRYDFRSGCCYDSQNRLLSFSLYVWYLTCQVISRTRLARKPTPRLFFCFWLVQRSGYGGKCDLPRLLALDQCSLYFDAECLNFCFITEISSYSSIPTEICYPE